MPRHRSPLVLVAAAGLGLLAARGARAQCNPDTVGPDITCSAQTAPCMEPPPPVFRAGDPARVLEHRDLAAALYRAGSAEEAQMALAKQLSIPVRNIYVADNHPELWSRHDEALSCANPCSGSGTLESDNPYYEVFLSCGQGEFTARTGVSHSVTIGSGQKQNVIYGGQAGSPFTSDITFRVHNTNTDYLNPIGGAACAFNPADTPTEPSNVGLEQEWTVSPVAGMTLRLREEIVAFGSTEANSGIRITLGATNLPSSTLTAVMGVRWQTDYQNSSDDGPGFAPVVCDPFSIGAERFTEHELPPSEIKDFYRIRNNTGSPIFSNYTNTAAILGFPGTGTPDRLVYGVWGSMFGSNWNYITNEGSAGPDSDSATLYYFGYTAGNGITLTPGQTFSRSIVIFTSGLDQSCGAFVPGTGTNGQVTICPDQCASAGATATDACGTPTVVLLSSSAGAPTCTGNPCTAPFPTPGSYVYTWQATDGSGNITTCTSTVNVRQPNDPACNQPPTCAAGGPYTSQCGNVALAATATDPDEDAISFTWTSSNPNISVTPPNGAIMGGPGPRPVPGTAVLAAGVPPCNQSAVLTLTINDGNGGTSTCTAMVTFNDTIAPVLANVPASVTVECNAVPPVPTNVTATDNCGPAVVTFQAVQTPGTCPGRYTITRTWTATDLCGRTSSQSQTITVRDTVAPVLANVPASVTVECNAVPAVPTNVTATDNCDGAPVVTFQAVQTPGTCPGRYTITRTWTATDNCGNQVSQSQTITVRDTVAPVLANVPPSVTVECNAVPPVPTNVTASDNCDLAPVVTFLQTQAPGACPQSYTLTRRWTATDNCGNASTQTQTITVRDTTAPTLVGVPPDATVECDAVPPPAPVTATDNCDLTPTVTFSETRIDGGCPSDYTLVRTWTATDDCGNVRSQTQTLTVQDTTPPVVQGGGANLACLWPPNHKYVCFRRTDFPGVAVSDNCSQVTWRIDGCASDQCDDAPCRDYPGQNGDGSTTQDCVVQPDGEGFCVRSERAGTNPEGRHYAVTVVATDACGNTSTPPTAVGYIYVPHDQSPHEDCIKP